MRPKLSSVCLGSSVFPFGVCLLSVACLLLGNAREICAAEPNETFATSTVLAAGTFSVSDELTPGQINRPDTLLGVRNLAGTITQVDDNSSTLGDGFASGVANVSTNSGGISFAVSGAGDTGFAGDHTQSGLFDVEVVVLDSLGELLTTFFTEPTSTLQQGQVLDFSFSGPAEWASYSANIDNGLTDPTGGDVDFFTFTGLVPGAHFSAETSDPLSGINTFMFRYNSEGVVVAADDNGGVDQFSLLEGTVPGDGRLTFAVTGFGDTFREGAHTEDGAYSLAVEIDTGIAADFNNSGIVDGIDLGIWGNSFGLNSGGDADVDGDSDGNDFLIWQRQLGAEISTLSTASIPEPSTACLFALAIALPLRRMFRAPL